MSRTTAPYTGWVVVQEEGLPIFEIPRLTSSHRRTWLRETGTPVPSGRLDTPVATHSASTSRRRSS